MVHNWTCINYIIATCYLSADLRPIQSGLNTATHLIARLPCYSHIWAFVHEDLHWLPLINSLAAVLTIVFTFKFCLIIWRPCRLYGRCLRDLLVLDLGPLFPNIVLMHLLILCTRLVPALRALSHCVSPVSHCSVDVYRPTYVVYVVHACVAMNGCTLQWSDVAVDQRPQWSQPPMPERR